MTHASSCFATVLTNFLSMMVADSGGRDRSGASPWRPSPVGGMACKKVDSPCNQPGARLRSRTPGRYICGNDQRLKQILGVKVVERCDTPQTGGS